MERYFTFDDLNNMKAAKTFSGLSIVAMRIIKRMPQPVAMVSGPLSTGGLGSFKENLIVFEEAVQKLSGQGLYVFNQLPFEEHMWRIAQAPAYRGADELLEEFYLPIFESGLVKSIYFIKGWETSYGASWEHRHAERLNIECIYL
ncbi:DUF4406 domain-containing protein [Candidatus Jorgensenbacteria bacterium]|nr:DUF4406 domain-containing protein [Candidatus Jorgensenbacteria bacterium]